MSSDKIQSLLRSLEIALDDMDSVIDTMRLNNCKREEINIFIKKRWQIWNEIYQVKQNEK